MHNRQPVFPIDIQYNLNTTNDADEVEHPLNMETFDTMLSAILSLRQKPIRKLAKISLKLKRSSNGITTCAIPYQRPLKSKTRFG